MRILGITQKWDKLKQSSWTTFRMPRKDKDWQVGEQVQIVFKPRSKERELLGVAEIISKEPRRLRDSTKGTCLFLTYDEAVDDGFEDWRSMWDWLVATYGIRRLLLEPINKLTLKWVRKERNNENSNYSRNIKRCSQANQ